MKCVLGTVLRIMLAICLVPEDLFAQPGAELEQQVESLVAEEDRRVEQGGDSLLLTLASSSSHAEVRRVAVRGLGRLERPKLVPAIANVLKSDNDPLVRGEAANALAQAVMGSNGDQVQPILTRQFEMESDKLVQSKIARAGARLNFSDTTLLAGAEATLLKAADVSEPTAAEQVALGFEALFRQNAGFLPRAESKAALIRMSTTGVKGTDADRADFSLVRATAWKALGGASVVDSNLYHAGLNDPMPEVRRSVIMAARLQASDAVLYEVLTKAFLDSAGSVRYEAIQSYGTRLKEAYGCGVVFELLDDPNLAVSLRAIQLLGSDCADAAEHPDATQILKTICTDFGANTGTEWHRAAHSVIALAWRSPAAAGPIVAAYSNHRIWQVRMYAARAAAIIRATDFLRLLAMDDHPNVVQAAIRGLSQTVGHEADGVYAAALLSGDYQVVLTAARNLKGSGQSDLLPGILESLKRISNQRRETSRDPRRALLDAVADLGSPVNVPDLTPYLEDFDPVIAQMASDIIGTWTVSMSTPSPTPLPRDPLPSISELRTLGVARVLFDMGELGVFGARLLPLEAPTVSAKFARLAEDGYFDGLTFHRVAPNFVIQGGSPGANEFMGAERYTRDEITDRAHVRGTLGISTRGRDTGDAQIFVNLVDNLRLNHNYTIFATVVGGMATVDRVAEGAVIVSVRIDTSPEP